VEDHQARLYFLRIRKGLYNPNYMGKLSAIFSLALSFFILMDAIGNIPIFLSLLKRVDPKRQRIIIFRELIIALVVIIIFNFVGEAVLRVLGISPHTVMMGGGIILFLVALKMVFPMRSDFQADLSEEEKEPFIVPMAIPMVAGPAILAAVMLYSNESSFVIVSAIAIAWIATTVILLASSHLKTLLGTRGITACERLMGLILILISIEMFLGGFKQFLLFVHE
jgi:multiple antibiotic resistance protein